MMYVFSVLIVITLVLSVFSVDEVTQGLGQWLGGEADHASAAGRWGLMVLIVVGVLLLIAYAARKKKSKK